MVIISNSSNLEKTVHQENGNIVGRPKTAQFSVKKSVSFPPSDYLMKLLYHSHLSTIIEEENESQRNYEDMNYISFGLSRSKRSFLSGLCTLVLASERLIEGASDCWTSSCEKQLEETLSCGSAINDDDSQFF